MSETAHSVESLQQYLESRIDAIVALQVERDRHYVDKFRTLDAATEKALAAVKEQTAAAFAANKEAVLKTEEAQRAYNLSHNDLARKMETQAKQFVDRDKLDDFAKRFIELLDAQRLERRQQTNWTIGHVIAIAFGMTAVATLVIELLRRLKP